MKEAAVIIGASSGLGRALAYELAEKGTDCIIAARNERELVSIASDLNIRFGIIVHVITLDLGKIKEKESLEFCDECFNKFSYLNQVYITAAIINENDQGVTSTLVLDEITEINYNGISHIVAGFSKKLFDKKSNITVISSIAAIRPRSINIAYAASKIALEYYIKGLQHFYASNRISLQIYRMGYMDTAMSHGKNLLFAKANTRKAAKFILNRKSSRIRMRYYPRFWSLIALILNLLPWFIYKKIKV